MTLAAGDDKTCTITNSDTPARITIIKQVINDNGGTARVRDFTLTLNAREVTSGEANTVAPGNYIAHELLTPAQQQAYTASSWTGDCQPDGRVTLAAGDDKTCIITNNDRPSVETRLTLIKQVINDNGGILGPQNFPLFVNDQLVVTGVTTIFAPGNYTVRETSQAGYVASGWSGDCSADGQVTLSAGENKTCLIINDDLPFTPPPPPPPPPLDICPNIPGNQLYVPVGLIRDINGNCVPPVIDFCPNIPGLQPAIPPGLVLDARGNCVQLLRPQGTLEKRGFSLPARGNVIQLGQQAQYELNFQALSPLPHVTIWDTMRPTLVGDKGGELTLDLNAFDGRPFAVQRVTPTGSQPLFRCDEQPDARVRTCYRGSPFTNNGLTVFNLDTLERVVILYRATLTRSAITAEFCKNLPREFCGEKFKNEARDSLGNVAGQFLYTPCPFLLTRGIGDVILERDLSVGSDILSCSGLPNIEGPVIRPEIPTPPMETPRTGPDDIINVPRHTVCKQSNQNTSSIPEAFRNPFQSLSSGICELSLNLSDDLTRPAIEKAILANVTRFTRFNDNLGVGTARTLTNLTEQPDAPLTNPNAAVYKLKGANLTIDPFVQPVGSGSRTYIIEDGDLIINGNVRFDENVTINSFKDTPSIAFIVINGSIRIAPTVTELDGVYVALKGESENSGKIFGSAPSERSLVVDGSIVGDLEPLFESRSYIGDARRNQGTIVINYGGWLFYNLPPVLRDIITIQEEQVAR